MKEDDRTQRNGDAARIATIIDVRELPQRITEALAEVEAGGHVILSDGSVPRARIVPMAHRPRIAGLHAETIQTAPDFDAPLSEDTWVEPS